MKNSLFKNFLIFFLIFILIGSIFSLYNANANKAENISLGAMVNLIQAGEVEKIEVEGAKINITLNNQEQKVSRKEAGESLSELLSNYGLEASTIQGLNVTIKEDSGASLWLGSILPFLIPLLLIGVFIWMMLRQVQGANNRAMSFGQSSAKNIGQENTKHKTSFKDVAGAEEAKEELSEIVEFLKFPKKFMSLGAKIPKGVLLLGPPGTGKTLLARAVAGEAKVPFFHISGSEFVEMFVGVGASRVRDLFKKAKKSSPCIIFIDEIDAVGRQRGAGLGGSHDEREQTLNQILVEMDGFETNVNVIVIAATNRPDVLDPALLRPGRFDRQVVIDLPDIKDRQAILEVHAKNKPLNDKTDLQLVAQRTPGFSGADLANVINEGAILTARRNKTKIGTEELVESIEKVMLGPERKSRIFSDEEKKITAYHEAGHALVAHLLPHADPVHKISIISRGRAAGYTMKLPIQDKHFKSKSEFLDELAVLLAGHVTEKEIFGDVTTGASNDLKEATRIAKQLITQYGMNENLGLRTFGQKDEMVFLGKEIHERRDYSEKIAEEIDKEMAKILDNAHKTAKELITKHKNNLDMIANKLLEQETIEKEEFAQMFQK